MSRTCESCGELIAFLDAQTTSGNSTWHTRCWNQAAEQCAAYIAECEDSEGFAPRTLPDELSKSETGADRSEVFPIMATAAAPNNTRAPREVVEFPPNVPVTIALKYGHAKTVSSQYGERFMFSLADGRVMFLDPEVGGKIEAMGINVRENFTITRKWDEQKSVTSWDVARLPGEQPNGTFVVPSVSGNGNEATPNPPASSANALSSTDGVHRKTAGRESVADRRDQRSRRCLRTNLGPDANDLSGAHQAGGGPFASGHGLHSAIQTLVCRITHSQHLADALHPEARPPPSSNYAHRKETRGVPCPCGAGA